MVNVSEKIPRLISIFPDPPVSPIAASSNRSLIRLNAIERQLFFWSIPIDGKSGLFWPLLLTIAVAITEIIISTINNLAAVCDKRLMVHRLNRPQEKCRAGGISAFVSDCRANDYAQKSKPGGKSLGEAFFL